MVQNFWLNPGVPLPPAGNFVTFISALISPTSRGFVKLASANPFTAPIIDPKFLTTQFDVFALREAVRAVKRLASANAWKGYIDLPFGGLAATSDADIDAYVRFQSTTVFHPVGTASMTAKNAKWGVVDPDLKVKGVEGVRVVDASVWVSGRIIALPASHFLTIYLAYHSERAYTRACLPPCRESCCYHPGVVSLVHMTTRRSFSPHSFNRSAPLCYYIVSIIVFIPLRALSSQSVLREAEGRCAPGLGVSWLDTHDQEGQCCNLQLFRGALRTSTTSRQKSLTTTMTMLVPPAATSTIISSSLGSTRSPNGAK